MNTTVIDSGITSRMCFPTKRTAVSETLETTMELGFMKTATINHQPVNDYRSKIDNIHIEELSAPITIDAIRKALTKLKAAGKSADFDFKRKYQLLPDSTLFPLQQGS